MSAAADTVAGELVQADDLKDVNNAVARFDAVAAGVAALQKQYGGVIYDVTTPKGMESAKEARRAIREPRYEIEKVRKAAKAPILALGRRIDGEAERITKQLLAIEGPIDQQIKAEEDRKEAERQAAIEAERRRIAAIDAQIDSMRQLPASVANKSAALIRALLDTLYAPSDFDFQERVDIAKTVRAEAISKLETMLAEREAFEAEQLRLAEERARLEEQRRKDEEAAAERQREEDERRRQEDARLQQERERLAAERAEQEAHRMRLSEIDGIRQQVIIASIGRAGVRAGGTLECAEETLRETEAWPLTEENFGPLLATAEAAKADAIRQIRVIVQQRRDDAAQREAAEAQQRERDQQEAQRQARIREDEERIARQRRELEQERAFLTADGEISALVRMALAATDAAAADVELTRLLAMTFDPATYGEERARSLNEIATNERDRILHHIQVLTPPPAAAGELTSEAVPSPPASDSAAPAAGADPEEEIGALLVRHPYPGDQALVDCIAVHLNVPSAAARQWLLIYAEANLPDEAVSL